MLNTYKTLPKENRDQNKWRDISWSFIERPNIVRMSFSPKLISRFNVVPMNTLAGFSLDIDKPDSKNVF